MSKDTLTLENYLKHASVDSKGSSTPLITLNQNLKNSLDVVSPLLRLSSKNKEQEFKQSVVEYVSSPETIKDISRVVGVPLEQETEDQFVERSMEKLKTYLLKKFG